MTAFTNLLVLVACLSALFAALGLVSLGYERLPALLQRRARQPGPSGPCPAGPRPLAPARRVRSRPRRPTTTRRAASTSRSAPDLASRAT